MDPCRRVLPAVMSDQQLGKPVMRTTKRARRRLPAARAFVPRELDAPYRIWGEDLEDTAVQQLKNACKLPVAVSGALMPDAHVGYGLPIGGVLATADAVIPYAVGVDIACRMRLSLYEDAPEILTRRKPELQKALLERTRFGMGEEWERSDRPAHEVP